MGYLVGGLDAGRAVLPSTAGAVPSLLPRLSRRGDTGVIGTRVVKNLHAMLEGVLFGYVSGAHSVQTVQLRCALHVELS
jgi:hypothetical protein